MVCINCKISSVVLLGELMEKEGVTITSTTIVAEFRGSLE